jgi:hypothetical protein
MVAVNRSPVARRRSNRMALTAVIGLSGEDSQDCSFTMSAKATNLNRHGAAVQLNRELVIGSLVLVRNARGTEVSARVVAQLVVPGGVRSYAIEFLEHNDNATNFWGITFPSVENRGATAQVAEQRGIARRRRGIPALQDNLSSNRVATQRG